MFFCRWVRIRRCLAIALIYFVILRILSVMRRRMRSKLPLLLTTHHIFTHQLLTRLLTTRQLLIITRLLTIRRHCNTPRITPHITLTLSRCLPPASCLLLLPLPALIFRRGRLPLMLLLRSLLLTLRINSTPGPAEQTGYLINQQHRGCGLP